MSKLLHVAAQAYMSRERLAAAKKLQLILVAGVGSDHIDLQAAAAAGLTVAECTGAFCQWRLSAHIMWLDASREALGAKQDIRHSSCDDRNCRGARRFLLSYLKLFVPHASHILVLGTFSHTCVQSACRDCQGWGRSVALSIAVLIAARATACMPTS